MAGSLRKTEARQEVVMETSKGTRAMVYVDRLMVLGALVNAESDDGQALEPNAG